MMAGGAALSSRGFAGARRRLRVTPWGGSTTLGFEFLRESRSYRAWFSRCLEMVFMLFGHEKRRFQT